MSPGGFKGSLPDDRKSGCLVNKRLPCHSDGWVKKRLSLIILIMGKAPNSSSTRELKDGANISLEP